MQLAIIYYFLSLLVSFKSIDIQDFPVEEGQLLLSSETFPLALNSFPNILVFFYKENDDACDQFYQFFNKLTSSQEGDQELRFSSIDIEEENELVSRKEYGISGKVPQVIMYVRGYPIEYDGGASLFYMRRWVSKRLQPKSRGIGSVEELDYFLNKFYPNQVKYIFVGANQAPAQFFLDFTIFLKRWEHMPAGHVMPKFGDIYQEIVQKYLPEKINIDQDNDEQSVVLMFRGSQFESNLTVIYNSSFWNLVDEFEDKGKPRIWYYDEYAKEHFFQLNKTFLLVAAQKGKEYQSLVEQVQEKYQGRLLFSVGDFEANHDINNIVQALGIENFSQPSVFIVNPMGKYKNSDVWVKYKMDEQKELNFDNLNDFIQSVLEGKLQDYHKSETLELAPPLSLTAPLPEHSIRLSSQFFGSFFNEFLPSRNILALFLMDNYCPYSKLLLPIYQSMAKLLHQKLSDQLVCICYNPTANEFSKELAWFNLPQGFPAVWIIKSDSEAMEKKQLTYKELPVSKRTAIGIFELVKEYIEISKEMEQTILDEIHNFDSSLKEFEDPLEQKQIINNNEEEQKQQQQDKNDNENKQDLDEKIEL